MIQRPILLLIQSGCMLDGPRTFLLIIKPIIFYQLEKVFHWLISGSSGLPEAPSQDCEPESPHCSTLRSCWNARLGIACIAHDAYDRLIFVYKNMVSPKAVRSSQVYEVTRVL